MTNGLRISPGPGPRLRTHRGVARLTALLLVVSAAGAGLTAGATLAAAAITTPFGAVFSTNATGDIQLRGNTLMTCPTAAAGCPAARNTAGGGAATNNALNDNNYAMVYVDADSDASTFNSSSSTVNLPVGATVLYAGLVWGGRPAAGATVGGVVGIATPAPANTNKVKLQAPGDAGYSNLTASATTTNAGNYQSFLDVTSIVQAAGNGSYTVADVQSGQGGDSYAGWGLAIAYNDPTAAPRNLTIFRGYGSVASGQSFDIPVSGFITPPSGPVRTTLGAVSYDGDMGLTGDQFLIGQDATTLANLSDPLHASTNAFDSTISDSGVDSASRVPKYKNQMGFDAATFNANGILPNSATSAVIRVTSTSETYYPGLITFASELYAPALNATKTEQIVAKAPGNTQAGVLEPGDTIEYTIDANNDGLDAAKDSVLTDAIPAGTTYLPESLSSGGVALTDADGDDVGHYDAAAHQIIVNLGTGATPTAGGKVAIGGSTDTIKFRVTANSDIANRQIVNNIAAFTYAGDLAGTVLTGASNAVVVSAVRRHSELAISKSADLTSVQRGAATPVTYTLNVTNSGPYDEPAATVTDTLPSGATFGAVTPSVGTCDAPAGRTVTCHLGSLVNGGTATVTVHAVLDGSADPATDTATVSGTNVDSVSTNDTATRSTIVNTAPVAVNDSATTTGGTATINVRGNDTDADGDSLQVSAPGGTAPTLGTVVVNPDRTVTYTAFAGQMGTDTFSYVIDDGRGGSATAVVTVIVPNQNPDAADDASSTTPGNAVTVPVLDNDTDPNIPTMPGQHLSVTTVTQPPGGAGTVVTDGSTVTFNPAASFNHASTTFSYTVSDGAGGTDTATVTITMANVGPVAAADTAITACIAPVDIDVLANDSDPNEDPLSVTGVTGATHGTASVTGTGPGSLVHYVPAAGWSGDDVLHYTLSDGTSTASGQVTVTTTSCAPVASPFSRTVGGGTSANIDVLAHVADPDTSAADLTVVGTGAAAHGTLTVNANNHVIYTPDPTYAGSDSFTYTASDPDGNTSTATVTLTVSNQSPTAQDDAALVPYNGSVDVDVLGDDTDPNGDPLSVSAVSTPAHGSATVHPDNTVTYAPENGFMGVDTFTYTISDGSGGTDTATVTVTVANRAPVAVDDAVDFTGTAGAPITIDVLANDSDPNGDPLTLDSVSVPLHGTAVVTAGQVVYTPDATYAGPDSFTYAISDGRGGHSVATISVDIHNRAPHAAADTATTSGGAVTLDVRANDTDADGDPLSVSAPGATTPTRGTVTVQPDKTITYTATPGQVGTDTFSYVIDDGRGGTDEALVTVTIPNAAPVATNDTSSTLVQTAVTVPVLDNDTDANIPTMPGQQLVVTGTTQPAGSTGAVTTDGTTVTFTPSTTFTHGTATFTYTVADGAGGTDTATVSISIDNSDPVASPDTATTTCVTAVDIDVLGNDSDPNDDALTVTDVTGASHGSATIVGTGSNAKVHYVPSAGWTGSDTLQYTLSDGTSTVTGQLIVSTGSCAPIANPFDLTVSGGTTTNIDVLTHATDPDNPASLTVTGTTSPGHGAVTADPDGTVNYIPDPGYAGPDSFTYTVTDSDGNTSTATVTLTVANQGPSAQDDTVVMLVNDSVDIAVLANDTDPNGDSLTLGSVSAPAHGIATPHADGTITYQPGAFYNGSDSFTYTISDGQGGSNTAVVNITIGNGAPVAGDDIETAAGGVGPVTLDVVTNDTDPNGDTLTVTAVSPPLHGAAVGQGGTVVYTPTPGYAGLDTFTYTVADGRGGSDTAVVTVTVANQTPVASDDAAATTPGNPVTVSVLDNDSDPNIPTVPTQHLTVTSVTQPADGSGTVTTDGTTVTLTPAAGFTHGSTTFSYTIADGAGGTDTATATITMANVAPVAAADTAATSCITGVDIDVLANDTDANDDPLTLTAVTDPAHGIATITGFGPATLIHYVPDGGWTGPDTLDYTVSDGTSTDTGHVTVTTGSCAPIADPFSITVDGGTTTGIDVLVHVTDPDSAGNLTVAGPTSPAHGDVTVDPDGTVRYTPDADYAGPDSFDYTVTDPDGNTSTGTVSITVRNQAPNAVDDSAIASGAAGSPVTVTVLTNDSDPNGDTLSLDSVSTPSHGTAVIVGGSVLYTPSASYTGPDSFTYAISDGNGSTATATVSVDVRNRAPNAVADTATTPVAFAVVIDALANDDDPDSEAVTLSSVQATSAHGGSVTVTSGGQFRYVSADGFTGVDIFTYVIVDARGATATGTVSVTVTNIAPVAPDLAVTTPGGQSVDVDLLVGATDADGHTVHVLSAGPASHGTVSLSSAGLATYTPRPGFVGTDTYTYVVSDGQGGQGTATVTVTVENEAPIAVDDAANTVAGHAVVVTALANDTDRNSPFLDQHLHVTGVTVTSGSATASILPDGRVRISPIGSYTGLVVVAYTIADADGAVSAAQIVVTVTPPVLAMNRSITLAAGKNWATIIPDDDITGHGLLTLTGVQYPNHGATVTVDGNRLVVHRDGRQHDTVRFTYVVVGADGVTITVTETVHLLVAGTTHSSGPSDPSDTQGSALPHTGANVVPAGILGLALTLVGGLACLFARRREEEEQD